MQLFTGHENGIPVRASIKLLLWLFTGISTLVAVLVTLLFFVDVDVYRGQIEHHVSTAFGRDVVLEGPLSLEPSLTPRFAVNGLKIANPDWASRPFLAAVDKFDIRVSLLPLLRGDLEIVSLEFHGVDLLLEFLCGDPARLLGDGTRHLDLRLVAEEVLQRGGDLLQKTGESGP